MATATPSTSISTNLLTLARNTAWGFLWGGGMLILLAFWLAYQHDSLPRLVPWVIGLFGLFAIAASIYQFWLVRQNRLAEWESHRAKWTWSSLVAALVGLGVAVWVLVSAPQQALSESLGCTLFAILALAQAYSLSRPTATEDSHPLLLALHRNWMAFRNALLLLGGVIAVAFIWLAFFKLSGMDRMQNFPELAGLALLAATVLFGALWLSMSPGQISLPSLRIFCLILGGVAGLIITLYALMRAWAWRQDIFLGGLVAWQGDNGWKVWVCAYVGLFGLVLMFASLLMARADIRNQPTLRRVLYGYNAVVTGLLVIAAMALVNIVVYAMFPMTFNWTKSRGLHTLAPSTKYLLAGLKEPTTIYVTVSQGNPIMDDLRNLLHNCQAQTNLLTVKYISPDRDFEQYKALAVNFPQYFIGKLAFDENPGRGLLIALGDHVLEDRPRKPAQQTIAHAFISERKLFEDSGRGIHEDKGRTLVFKGEPELANELSTLTESHGKERKKRKVYFLQGNGELDISSRLAGPRPNFADEMAMFGAAVLVEKLKKDAYEVHGLTFNPEPPKGKAESLLVAPEGADKKRNVPEDCYALVLAGPTRIIPKDTLEALERYMDRGGKMLVYLDVIAEGPKSFTPKKSGIEGFLEKYGISPVREIASQVDRFQRPTQPVFASASDSDNPLAKQFARQQVPLNDPLVIKPDAGLSKFKAEVIWELNPHKPIRVMGDREQALVAEPDFAPRIIAKHEYARESLPVAVAVTEENNKIKTPRLVVVGDTENIANWGLVESLERDLPGDRPYYDFFASALAWLAERKDIGVKPKESGFYKLPSEGVNIDRMILWPGWLMLLGVLGLGGGVWLTRRR